VSLISFTGCVWAMLRGQGLGGGWEETGQGQLPAAAGVGGQVFVVSFHTSMVLGALPPDPGRKKPGKKCGLLFFLLLSWVLPHCSESMC
jgi:hypothetical protein